MSTPTIITLIILALLAVAAAALKKKPSNSSESSKYRARPLLTANELEFITRLEAACPELRFHTQVCMAALIEPDMDRNNRSAYASARGRVAQKMIDYVAQDRNTGKIVAIIELDDRTHNKEKDEQRDTLTAAAGYKTIRWNSKNKPSVDDIRKELIDVI